MRKENQPHGKILFFIVAIVITTLSFVIVSCGGRVPPPIEDLFEIILIAPENGAEHRPTNLDFHWEVRPKGQSPRTTRNLVILGYKFYLDKADEEGFPTEPTEIPDILDVHHHPVTDLDLDTAYKWKVEVVLLEETILTSVVQTFTTVDQLYNPPTVELAAPLDAAIDQPVNLTLEWEGTPGDPAPISGSRAIGIREYEVYIAEAGEEYGDPEIVTLQQVDKTGLKYATTYRWKVVAIQEDDQEGESNEWTFTTMEANFNAPTVELVSPVNGATEQPQTVTLQWQGTPGDPVDMAARTIEIREYKLYFAEQGQAYDDPEILNGVVQEKTGLEKGTTYTWKVVAVQEDDQEGTSEEWTFTTVHPTYQPPTVQLASPANGAENQPINTTLQWVGTPGDPDETAPRAIGIKEYEVYFARHGQAYGLPETVTESELLKTDLDYETTYKWMVKAIQDDDKEGESAEWTFTTRAEGEDPSGEWSAELDIEGLIDTFWVGKLEGDSEVEIDGDLQRIQGNAEMRGWWADPSAPRVNYAMLNTVLQMEIPKLMSGFLPGLRSGAPSVDDLNIPEDNRIQHLWRSAAEGVDWDFEIILQFNIEFFGEAITYAIFNAHFESPSRSEEPDEKYVVRIERDYSKETSEHVEFAAYQVQVQETEYRYDEEGIYRFVCTYESP